MEEGDNFIANVTEDPFNVTVPDSSDSSVGICGLNATLFKEYVK